MGLLRADRGRQVPSAALTAPVDRGHGRPGPLGHSFGTHGRRRARPPARRASPAAPRPLGPLRSALCRRSAATASSARGAPACGALVALPARPRPRNVAPGQPPGAARRVPRPTRVGRARPGPVQKAAPHGMRGVRPPRRSGYFRPAGVCGAEHRAAVLQWVPLCARARRCAGGRAAGAPAGRLLHPRRAGCYRTCARADVGSCPAARAAGRSDPPSWRWAVSASAARHACVYGCARRRRDGRRRQWAEAQAAGGACSRRRLPSGRERCAARRVESAAAGDATACRAACRGGPPPPTTAPLASLAGARGRARVLGRATDTRSSGSAGQASPASWAPVADVDGRRTLGAGGRVVVRVRDGVTTSRT